MTPAKRPEFVIEAAHTPGLLKALRQAGAPGWTIVRDVQGMGRRGERMGDELTDVYRNCYVLVACDPDVAETLIEAVRPVLDRHGGLCLVSDARWLRR